MSHRDELEALFVKQHERNVVHAVKSVEETVMDYVNSCVDAAKNKGSQILWMSKADYLVVTGVTKFPADIPMKRYKGLHLVITSESDIGQLNFK